MEKDVNSDLVLKLGVVFQVNGLLKIYFTVIEAAGSGPYRVAGIVRKDNTLPEKKGNYSSPRKGRVRDASIEIATCYELNDVSATKCKKTIQPYA